MARTMSPEEYRELGKRYYKQKQYDKAIETFTDGIEATTHPSISLLDYRAACYEKLAKFSLAVKDGREMIRLYKQNVKGYLRTARVLEKMNKLDIAINIYKYGMKNVPINDSNFKLLQQLHDRLNRKLSPAKAKDPLAVLPAELMDMVVGYLTFKTMVRCLGVSKAWMNYLIKQPNLWMDLDLSGASRNVSKEFVRKAINHSDYRITRATIHRFENYRLLVNIATACKSLTDLEFLSGGILSASIIEIAQCAFNLKRLVVHTDLTLDTVTQILRWRPTLEHVEFPSICMAENPSTWKGHLPDLHTLVLNVPARLMSRALFNLESLAPVTPALRCLTLTGWGFVTTMAFATLPLTTLVLRNVQVPFFPRLPPTLRHLLLQKTMSRLPEGPTDNRPSAAMSWSNAVHSHLPNLTYLGLSSWSNLNPAFLEALLEFFVEGEGPEVKQISKDNGGSLSSLQHVSIRDNLIHADVPLFGVGGVLSSSFRVLTRSLISLDIATLPCTDDDIEQLLIHQTSLQTIDLSQTKITGASVKMLVDELPGLRFLNLDNCTRISSRDAIHYAEKRGVTVSCKMSEIKKGSRITRRRTPLSEIPQ